MAFLRDDRIAASLVFLAFFALYLTSASPHFSAYRDAGEIAIAGTTLGVAHPPGYPLYTVAAHVGAQIPIGNPIYRINIFSGIAGAAAIAFLFLLIRTWAGSVSSLAGAALFGLSNPFWELATVAEMYTLGAALFFLILIAIFRLKRPELTMFVTGLALGVRMDLLLLVPVFWLSSVPRWNDRPRLLFSFLFLALGASVFLYLPIRSLQDPWLDWGNPETLSALIKSVTRASYGGTLDLVSAPYGAGVNFADNLSYFVRHLFRSTGWALVPAALAGAFLMLQRERRAVVTLIAILVAAGPLFIFIANLPPNPHALAILDASFVLPDAALACLAGLGFSLIPGRKAWLALAAVAIAFLPNSSRAMEQAFKRNNRFASDYVTNVFRSAPMRSIVVFHEDVQLFSLWAAQLLERRRPDLSILADGLSGSPWYHAMVRRWPVAPAPAVSLKEPAGWNELLGQQRDRPVVTGVETDVSAVLDRGVAPVGLVQHPGGEAGPPDGAVRPLLDFAVYRGRYSYEQAPDFFVADLVSDYARAFHRHALAAMRQGQSELAHRLFLKSQALEPAFAQALADHGYLFYTAGRVLEAAQAYGAASGAYERLLDQAREFRSLPGVVRPIRLAYAQCQTHLGVIEEKAGRRDAARLFYERSIKIEDNAQAHYNLAVTYWNRDWPVVIRHLRRAGELGMPEARRYLQQAEALANKP